MFYRLNAALLCTSLLFGCGANGEPGKDADPSEVASAILADEALRSALVQALADDENLKGEPGTKGDPGEKGAPGEQGQPGTDGEDGAFVENAGDAFFLGQVGIGIEQPQAPLHVKREGGGIDVVVEDEGAADITLRSNQPGAIDWILAGEDTGFSIKNSETNTQVIAIDEDNNVTVDGGFSHPAVAKAWLSYDGDSEEVISSFNIMSVRRISAGAFEVLIDVPAGTGLVATAVSSQSITFIQSISENRIVIQTRNDGNNVDPALLNVVVFGD